MRKIILIILITLIGFSAGFAQGKVRGKISDRTGETLIGVTVSLKSSPDVGVTTDLDGNYSLMINDSTSQTIVITYVSYAKIEADVHVLHGEVVIKDFVMESATKDLGVVEVVTKASKAKDYYMENLKKNSSSTIDYISSETMKKTGDASVVSAIARVTGVSTNSGGFITVRGIGDRYVKTTINGNRIPTLDPFTNNIKLDMFPASLVDNIIITKTASADLPGDWAGAYLSVETKDYPEQFALSIETQVGYNTQSTFKDVISSERSSTDWMGYDNGLRAHDHSQFQSANITPNQYQTFVALGLGSYYQSIGVTGWNDGAYNNLYFRLGLVQLGLLAPALINNTAAVTAATTAFNTGPYKAEAFSTLNAGAAKTGQSFPDNWNTTTRKAPLDFSQSFSVGDQLMFLGKPLGFVAGFRYGTATVYDPNSIAQRPSQGTSNIESTKDQQASRETNGWSALINVAYKLNTNNTVSLMFMPNLTGENKVKSEYEHDNTQSAITIDQRYESRKQNVYQFKSEHYLPSSKIKIDLNASYTKGISDTPDFKDLTYNANLQTNSFSIDPLSNPINRYYALLTDNLFDSHVSAEIPLGNKPGLPRKLKIGGAYQADKQKNDQYNYLLGKGSDPNAPKLTNTDLNSFFNLNQFGLSNGTDFNGVPFSILNWYYIENNIPTDHTFGTSNISAAFIMADYTIVPRLRVSGGVRVEHTNTFTDVDRFDSLGLAADDPRRYYQTGVAPATPGVLNEINYLPSANVICKLKNSEEAPINVRLGYSENIARPSIRELSNTTTFDYELQAPVMGNPNLKMVHIKNYDFRIESYFKNKDNVSLSVFYKDFKNHIELEQSEVFTWINVDKSRAMGVELEGRKSITKHFEVRANITLVQSTTTFVRTRTSYGGVTQTTYYEDTVTRPMFGQAPYIINGIVSYNSDSLGLTATLSYNIQGPRLVIGSDNPSIKDIYEMPRNLLDFKVSKKLGKHFSVSVTVKNILNSYVTRKYKYDDGYDVTYDRYRWGTIYLLGVLYKI